MSWYQSWQQTWWSWEFHHASPIHLVSCTSLPGHHAEIRLLAQEEEEVWLWLPAGTLCGPWKWMVDILYWLAEWWNGVLEKDTFNVGKHSVVYSYCFCDIYIYERMAYDIWSSEAACEVICNGEWSMTGMWMRLFWPRNIQIWDHSAKINSALIKGAVSLV